MGGNKIVCVSCKRISNSFSEKVCAKCGEPMTILPHRFRPPKQHENKKWKIVKYLVENGFYFQHVFKNLRLKNRHTNENYADYPKTLYDAKVFIEAFKQQARMPETEQ